LKASARQILLASSTLMVEVEALRHGIWLLGLLPQQMVILETDSLELANLWRGRENHRSEIHPILQDVQTMSIFFSEFMVRHTKCSRNVALICARNATDNSALVWEGSLPSF
jgi:hypothetical protein